VRRLAACLDAPLLVALLGASEEGCAAAVIVRTLGCVQGAREQLVAAGCVERLAEMLASGAQARARTPQGRLRALTRGPV
jgi:hypothetical protein